MKPSLLIAPLAAAVLVGGVIGVMRSSDSAGFGDIAPIDLPAPRTPGSSPTAVDVTPSSPVPPPAEQAPLRGSGTDDGTSGSSAVVPHAPAPPPQPAPAPPAGDDDPDDDPDDADPDDDPDD